jgi:hypothetical protein
MSQMIPAGQYNRIAYFYASDSTTTIGIFNKDVAAYVMCRLDYSGLTVPPGTETASFSIDIGSNPPLAVSSSNYDQTNKHLDFIVSGGVEGQKYNLTATITGTINRSDVITFDVPLTTCDCGSVSLSPNVASYPSGTGMVFVNSAIKYSISTAAPSGANIKDQWYNSSTGVLYEYITDGVSFWWQQMIPTLGATFLTYKMKALTLDGFTTDFTLQTVDGKTPDVLASTDLIVSVDDVIQNPDLEYKAFHDQIQFTTPPAADSIVFITWLAHY